MVFCALVGCCCLQADLHFLFTSAIIERNYEKRKTEYLKGLRTIRSYGFEPWIIETRNISASFFDPISERVLYPQCNIDSLQNKGANEVMAIRACISHLPFNDEDMVIKMTGRYFLYSRDFVNLIESTQTDYDAYVLSGKHFIRENDIFAGCFAMRWKYFKEMIEQVDVEKIESEMISVETVFADYIREFNLREKRVTQLHMIANVDFPGLGFLIF